MSRSGERGDREAIAVLEFGQCRLFPESGELFVRGARVALGRRALDILMVLIESRGSLVSKDAILARAWPSAEVGENALHVQISSLRKALGVDGALLKTAAGRGYRFEATVKTLSFPREPAPAGEAGGNLPAPISALIGREAELFIVAGLLASYRAVTLSGMGGIGKTRLAIEGARGSAASFRDGAWMVDLSMIADPRLLLDGFASALGLELGGKLSEERVARALAPRQMLIVLDNCEHLAATVTSLASAILHGCPQVRVLATSQEPLRIEGEFVYRVGPLSLPPAGERETIALLAHGATRLFVSRVQHAAPDFPLNPETTACIVNICRQLDGIPLAIELAAARATTLGLESLTLRLSDRFAILTNGGAAVARHRTLRSAIDWSYELLTEGAKGLLQGLGAFTCPFPLEVPHTVAGSDSAMEAEAWLAELVAKSFVLAEFDGSAVRYRMLQTMRAYALEKAGGAGKRRGISERHAAYFAAFCAPAAHEWQHMEISTWLDRYLPCLPEVRVALDWAFSHQGDPRIAADLVEATVPLWLELSLMDEACERLESALTLVQGITPGEKRREMRLRAALGLTLTFSAGPEARMREAWRRTFALAEELDDSEFRAAALFGMWAHAASNANYALALDLALELRAHPGLQRGHSRSVADGMIGNVMLYRGQLAAAREKFEQALGEYEAPTRRGDVIACNVVGMRIDPRLAAKAPLAQVLWLQGRFDEGWELAEEALMDARASGHPTPRAYALTDGVCRLALFSHDVEALQRYTRMLLAESEEHGLSYWIQWAHTFEGTLRIKQGDVQRGISLLESALPNLGGREPWIVAVHAALAEGLAAAGQHARALAQVQQGIDLSESGGVGWHQPEAMRVKGDILAAIDPDRAEQCLLEAYRLAAGQGALAWELRCALSLERLPSASRRASRDQVSLARIYARFDEGFTSRDLAEAAALLALQDPSLSRGA